MLNDLISIIIPVYNVEEYLDECIESVIIQSYKNIEVILVDDGSTDLSGRKCDYWGQQDSRIRVLHKSNGGLADARNAGVKIAKGKYIGFVDSDDLIDPDMYKELLEAIYETKTKMAMCSFITNKERETYPVKNANGYIIPGKELANTIVLHKNKEMTFSVWKCLYHRDLVVNKEFPEGRLFEDVVYNISTIYDLDYVAYIPKALYFYRIREESITNKALSLKAVEDVVAYNQGLLDFYNSRGTKKEIKNFRIYSLYEILLYNIISRNNNEIREAIKYTNDYIVRNHFSIKDTNFNIKTIVKFLFEIKIMNKALMKG